MSSNSHMTQTLSAKEQPLSKIFSGDYVFSIPGYQRPYSWGTEQAQELLDDLLDYMGAGSGQSTQIAPYFLGTIVLIKEEMSSESIVVDGQQRLTTLTLLLSAIRSTVDDLKVRDGITKRIYEHGDVVTTMDARSGRVLLHMKFWTGFLNRACERTELFGRLKPTGKQWISVGMGRGIGLAVVVNRDVSRVTLHIQLPEDDGSRSRAIFDALHAYTQKIESEYGTALLWERSANQKRSVIQAEIPGGSNTSPEAWPELQNTLLDIAIRVAQAFREPLRALNA